jgi:tetratricopeptide (TPR) repeat protein
MHPNKQDTLSPFVIAVGKGSAGRCPVAVEQSPHGPSAFAAEAYFDVPALHFQQALLLPYGKTALENVRAYGSELFRCLMVGEILPLYRASRTTAEVRQQCLVLHLRIADASLAALPWEYLYDHEDDTWLAAGPGHALVRSIPLEQPLSFSPLPDPLRVLVATAQPHDLAPIDVSREIQALRECLTRAGGRQREVQIELLEHAGLDTLKNVLDDLSPHIWHFVGHGFAGNEAGAESGYLLLEDGDGNARPASADELALLLGRSAGGGRVRLVVLNACSAGVLSSSHPFTGLAPRLLACGPSVVVAMQSDITTAASATFTAKLYAELAAGAPLESAAAEARRMLVLDFGLAAAHWATPVVYRRAGNEFASALRLAPRYEQGAGIPDPTPPLQPLRSPVFVGHADMLDKFSTELAADRFVVLAGAPGIGKTELATRLVERAAPGLDGVFWYRFSPEPDADDLAAQLANFLAWHRRDEPWRRRHTTGGGVRVAHQQLLQALPILSGGGFLLYLEDMHHLPNDGPIGEFIARLVAQRAELDVRLVFATRKKLDIRLVKTGTLIPGLPESAVRQYLALQGLSIADEQIRQLHAWTEGNPQVLVLAVAVLREGADPQWLLARFLERGEGVFRFLLEQVHQNLSQEQVAVMKALAVQLGYPALRRAIDATVGAGNHAATLLGLLQGGLLVFVEGNEGREFSLTQLMRAFYYDEIMDDAERVALHSRAAQYFRSLGGSSAWLAAVHSERAHEYADTAVLVAENFDQVLLRSSWRELDALLGRLQAQPLEAILRVRLRLARARTAGALQGWEAAVRELLPAVALAEGNAYYGAFVRYQLAQAYLKLRLLPEARSVLVAGIELLPEQGLGPAARRLLARLHIALAVLHMQQAAEMPAAQTSLAAAERLLQHNDDELLAQLASARASFWRQAGDLDKAIEAAEAAWQHVQAKPPGEPRFATASNLAFLLLQTTQPAQVARADDLLADAEQTAEQVGHPEWRAQCRQIRGLAHFDAGETEQAAAAYLDAYRIFSSLGDRESWFDSCYNLAEAYAKLDQCHEARRYFQEAATVAGPDAPDLLQALAELASAFPNCLVPEA